MVMAERIVYLTFLPSCFLLSKVVEWVAPSQADLEASPAAIQFQE